MVALRLLVPSVEVRVLVGKRITLQIINESALQKFFSDERVFKLRSKQLLNHYFTHLTKNPDDMSDIGNAAFEIAKIAYDKPILKEVLRQVGDGGQTIKTLYELEDGEQIESVLMFYDDRATLCISSQVGCAMACPFCATGGLGLTRNLSAEEICEQIWMAAREVKIGAVNTKNTASTRKLTNIVFMGMGEPTQNLDNIYEVLGVIPKFGISMQNVTISTVGDVEGIRSLAYNPSPFRLAISLHAPNDDLRNKLVPMNRKYDVAQVISAGYDYYLKKGRRISIEYALMKDINDSEKCAYQLAKILNREPEIHETHDESADHRKQTKRGGGASWAHVNLIPLNEVEGSPWTASTPEATMKFISALESKGVTVTLRDSRGNDIDGACGQLANSVQKTSN